MFHRIIVAMFFLLLFISCEPKSVRNIESHVGEKKIYFITPEIDNERFDINDSIQKKYGNFYIDDNKILNEIGSTLIKEKVKRSFSGSIYIYRYYLNNSFQDGGIIDLGSSYIDNNKKFRFDVEGFFKYSNSFEDIESFEVNCYSLKTTKILVEYVKTKKGFVRVDLENWEEIIDNYIGKIEVEIDPSKFGISYINSIHNTIPNRIKEQCAKFGEVYVLNHKYQKNELFSATLLVKSNEVVKLPEGYQIKELFKSEVDFPVLIYDIKRNDIESFFKENNIDDFLITEL